MASIDTSREPCPGRILGDTGGAFGMGVVGGSAWHFLRGLYNSPRGARLIGAGQAVRMNAPRIGGSFAVWGGLFSVFDCSLVFLRQKEGPWNSIISGAMTGGLLSMRRGLRVAARSAASGGLMLALIEGAGIAINKYVSTVQYQPILEEARGSVPAGLLYPVPDQKLNVGSEKEMNSGSGSGWFGGWFGAKKEEEGLGSGGGVKTEVLESFDKPMPNFHFK
ncbi:hypothetical protein RJ641_026839 [Dillenia turbinata]|uniref:Mitochondrial import inner membrane translocase subunit TIM17 n=1 Tax=Dillenia turbinata TaxID=194707 RepID=A0AAN8ZL38_9MAGN